MLPLDREEQLRVIYCCAYIVRQELYCTVCGANCTLRIVVLWTPAGAFPAKLILFVSMLVLCPLREIVVCRVHGAQRGVCGRIKVLKRRFGGMIMLSFA